MSAAAGQAEAPALPDGWVMQNDQEGRTYYESVELGVTQWDFPDETKTTTMPFGWEKQKAPDGRVYFENAWLAVTQWNCPQRIAAPPVEGDEPLADGWVVYSTDDGRVYYESEALKLTQWARPDNSLPAGWVCLKSPDGEDYYEHVPSSRTQWEHPASVSAEDAVAVDGIEGVSPVAARASTPRARSLKSRIWGAIKSGKLAGAAPAARVVSMSPKAGAQSDAKSPLAGSPDSSADRATDTAADVPLDGAPSRPCGEVSKPEAEPAGEAAAPSGDVSVDVAVQGEPASGRGKEAASSTDSNGSPRDSVGPADEADPAPSGGRAVASVSAGGRAATVGRGVSVSGCAPLAVDTSEPAAEPSDTSKPGPGHAATAPRDAEPSGVEAVDAGPGPRAPAAGGAEASPLTGPEHEPPAAAEVLAAPGAAAYVPSVPAEHDVELDLPGDQHARDSEGMVTDGAAPFDGVGNARTDESMADTTPTRSSTATPPVLATASVEAKQGDSTADAAKPDDSTDNAAKGDDSAADAAKDDAAAAASESAKKAKARDEPLETSAAVPAAAEGAVEDSILASPNDAKATPVAPAGGSEQAAPGGTAGEASSACMPPPPPPPPPTPADDEDKAPTWLRFKPRPTPEDAEPWTNPQELRDQLAYFYEIDAGNTGFVDRDDMRRFSELNDLGFSDDDIAKAVEMQDFDSDGKVTLRDFLLAQGDPAPLNQVWFHHMMYDRYVEAPARGATLGDMLKVCFTLDCDVDEAELSAWVSSLPGGRASRTAFRSLFLRAAAGPE